MLFLCDKPIMGLSAVVRTLLCSLLLSSLQVSVAYSSTDSNQAATLLGEMSLALRESDYRGIFTYEYGGVLKTLRVTHQVTDEVEYEYLEHLNGPPMRIEHSGRSVNCLPEADKVLRGLLPSLDGNLHGLDQHYHFYIRDDVRIAERVATVVQIVPRDQYRYGYTLSIDKESKLPLAVMTLDTSRRVMERLQFITLDLEPSDDWIESVDSSMLTSRPAWPNCANAEGSQALQWQVSWMPSGFIAAGHSTVEEVGDVMLFTDGLSAFSVFVRPFEKELAAQGKAQRGATVAYMRQQMLGGTPYTITVVGELPARTAQRIATSVVLVPVKPPSLKPEAIDANTGS